MSEPLPLEMHKALADDTRYRLYRYLRLSGRSVPVRELAARLSLHPNTIRPHLRRLEEVGLVATETRRGTGAGRPQVLYTAVEPEPREGRDFRLLADILAPLVTSARQRDRAVALARDWGAYLVGRRVPRPGARRAGLDLASLRDAMAEAGFDPRFRRHGATSFEVTMRDCPARDLLDEHGELICAVHRGLLDGMLQAARPPLRLVSFDEPADRTATCRLVAASRAR
jgi:predicted ArsR family transcriptional regulator